MEALSRRNLDRIYSAVLLAVVVLSWSYVIYASRIAASWLLERRTAAAGGLTVLPFWFWTRSYQLVLKDPTGGFCCFPVCLA